MTREKTMEGNDNNVVVLDQHVQGGSAGAGTPASCRWNPTKEQISMLENLYRQGIRTPSADQIQQITSRLRTFGHIEGKNVFYWFQNHKARQRQKQKQESMAYINRFYHPPTHPIFPPPSYHPCPNVICSPYYIPVQSEIGFYHQQSHPFPKVPLSVGVRRRPRTEKLDKPTRTSSGGDINGYSSGVGGNINDATNKLIDCDDQETLPLFPLQPTGILQGREENPSSGSGGPENFSTAFGSCEIVGGPGDDQPFYDFFSGGQSCCEND